MTPIQLHASELKPVLPALAKVASRKPTLSVLGTILVQRDGLGTVTLTANNPDSCATATLPAGDDGAPLSLLVPLAGLRDIAKNCQKGDVLSLSPGPGNEVTIQHGDIRHRLDSFPVDDFVPIPEVKGGEAVILTADMREKVQQAFQCASEDPTRFTLTCAFLDVSQTPHCIVGTDGVQMFISNVPLPLRKNFMLPDHPFFQTKGINSDGDWCLTVTERLYRVTTPHWSFIGRNIEGNFLNWRQVVPNPDAAKTTLDFDPAAVPAIMRTITQLPDTDPINHKVTLKVEKPAPVTLLVPVKDSAEFTSAPIPGAIAKGPDIRIFLNRTFLARALGFGLTRLSLADNLSPMTFENAGAGTKLVVMPVRHK